MFTLTNALTLLVFAGAAYVIGHIVITLLVLIVSFIVEVLF